ncbi:AraC family transcriptional regulator [Rhizobium sp. Root1203]|uniref:helix-turn-helix domain-containing protein n=1 Tax=Rhizobium sp. Root1203 TaxID=1736427 RepID=UPI000710EB4E|nr:AraC family transcriptional regulator [Rhizobium sp. Root1203]KQV27146.1 AraC family transcriptional regulator [Rhizobium sp. Root1203]
MTDRQTNPVMLAPWRIKRAVDFIEMNLATPLHLADIARAAGLSPMHFAAGFRSATGLSPHAYLRNRRIERAKRKLLSDGLSIDEIAFNVGFRSQSHFITVFRHLTGQPPARWRRCCIKNGSPLQEAGQIHQ